MNDQIGTEKPTDMEQNASEAAMHHQKEKFGVMLVNLGTPEAPTPKAVRKYLAEFLWDRRVVDVPRILWWMILNLIILRFRPKRVAKAYQSIWWGEGSPLMVISKRQTEKVKVKLKEMLGQDIPVSLAMTYGKPTMEQAATELRQQGVTSLVVLPLYPQNSSSTVASVFDRLAEGLKGCPYMPKLHFINQYYSHPLYIQALANSVKEHWEKNGRAEKLMMSFHGIPQRYADRGDPYQRQCVATANLLANRLGLSEDHWICSFQSRFGREEWIKPYTDYVLEEWAEAGVKTVDVICPAFAADCLETLEEIEEENAELFVEKGGEKLSYIPALNDREDHIELLASLVIESLPLDIHN